MESYILRLREDFLCSFATGSRNNVVEFVIGVVTSCEIVFVSGMHPRTHSYANPLDPRCGSNRILLAMIPEILMSECRIDKTPSGRFVIF